MLNALFVTYGWIFVRRASPWFSRILAAIAVHVIKIFGLGVIRFQLVIADGPRGRDTTVMTNLAKVLLSQTEECRAVELCVTTHKIIRVRVQLLPFTVAPRLFGVVFRFEIY